MSKLEAIINQFEQSLNRFREVMKEERDEIVRDSAIKRFELTLDLSWKMLKAFFEEKAGLSCRSPKECFREAYSQKLVEYGDYWLELVDLRNEAVHTYKEELAERIYGELPQALEYFDVLFRAIRKKMEGD